MQGPPAHFGCSGHTDPVERDPIESVRRLPSREPEPAQPPDEAPTQEAPPPEPKPKPKPKPARQTPPRKRARASAQRKGAVAEVRDVSFPVVFRGYDRAAVDAYVAKVSQLVAELEATQLREGVVQRALEEVGEQTSSLLQHAHETAEEITASSRSQAEGRLQRARREAAELRAEADRYVQEVQADTASLREERLRLIEEIRQFADEVLGVADDALERLPDPSASTAPEGADGDDPAAEPES
jgi:DivIVA domain-containing protein